MKRPRYKTPDHPLWAKVAGVLVHAAAKLLDLIGLGCVKLAKKLSECCLRCSDKLLEVHTQLKELRM